MSSPVCLQSTQTQDVMRSDFKSYSQFFPIFRVNVIKFYVHSGMSLCTCRTALKASLIDRDKKQTNNGQKCHIDNLILLY